MKIKKTRKSEEYNPNDMLLFGATDSVSRQHLPDMKDSIDIHKQARNDSHKASLGPDSRI